MNTDVMLTAKLAGSNMLQSRVDRLKLSKTSNATPEELRKVARDLESIFINLLLKEMRKTVPKGYLNSGFIGELYVSMADSEFAQELARRGMGLSDMIYENISTRMGIGRAKEVNIRA